MKEAKRPILRFFNLFDIVAILVILALALVLVLANRAGTEASAKDGSVTFTLEFTGMQNGSEQMIAPGDRLTDKIKKYSIGTVDAVEITDTPLPDDPKRANEDPGKTAYVTVTAPCTETETEISVGGGFLVRVGLPVSVRGPGYFGSGYIVGIQRGEGE